MVGPTSFNRIGYPTNQHILPPDFALSPKQFILIIEQSQSPVSILSSEPSIAVNFRQFYREFCRSLPGYQAHAYAKLLSFVRAKDSENVANRVTYVQE